MSEDRQATKMRNKEDGSIASFCGYNYHGVGEFIALFEDGSKSSEYIRDSEPIDGRWPDER